jgi:hypothetical protein
MSPCWWLPLKRESQIRSSKLDRILKILVKKFEKKKSEEKEKQAMFWKHVNFGIELWRICVVQKKFDTCWAD